jgi:phosphate transport system substrate-binding protein
MRRMLASLAVAATATAFAMTGAGAAQITGAGATFPYPIYGKWAETYHKDTGIELNYQSIGSGGGIKQIEASTVDFGASDAPLTAEELDKNGLIQFPTVMGGIVPIVNLEGIKPGELVMSGQLVADIYLGKVTKWNDPEIAKLNPTAKLPASDIAVVHRSDGSGTTFNFTYYLNEVSPEWKDKVGSATSVEWPAGTGGKGNEGVANYVKQIKNSIGYVEYAYALENKLTYSNMLNKAGKVVKPDISSFQAAAAGADWKNAPGFHLVLANQPGDDSWPMTAATFILLHKQVKDEQAIKNVLDFFDWAYKNGDKEAESLDYVPLPSSVKDLVRDEWKTKLMTQGGKPLLAN